ncbi:MAG: zinc-ribbon domain-containing protein, partial [Lachnospiraceae bacterium]|nr:zinc-ribbon domain-containing protein [Lachnospiraceae bacterium]
MAKLIIGVNDLATVNPELAKEWNYEKNEKTPQDYTSGSGVKVWWKCEKGHEWQAIICSRNYGHGCPYCSNRLVKQGFNDLVTTHPKLAKEWNYDKNIDSPQDYTKGSQKKVWWKCKNGHEWQTSIVTRATYASMCPYCGNKKVLQGYNDLSITNPELLTEWNYVKNGIVTPQIVSKGSEKKVWWVCEKGHEYQADIGHRVRGQGCPYCTGQRILQGFNDLITTNPELIKEWNYKRNKNSPQHYTKGSQKKVWWL